MWKGSTSWKREGRTIQHHLAVHHLDAPLGAQDDLLAVVPLAEDLAAELLVVRLGSIDRRRVPECSALMMKFVSILGSPQVMGLQSTIATACRRTALLVSSSALPYDCESP